MLIREVKQEDVNNIVNLHLKCLPQTTSSKIGRAYLQAIYKVIADNPRIHPAYLMIENNKIIGTITTTTDLAATQKLILKSTNLNVIVSCLSALINGEISLTDLLNKAKFEKELARNFKKPYLSILTIFIDPDYRRKKLGQQLLKIIINLSQKFKKHLYVDTLKSNKNAISFYQASKFKNKKVIMDSLLFEYQN